MIKKLKEIKFFTKIRNKIILTMLISLICSFIAFFTIAELGASYIFKGFETYLNSSESTQMRTNNSKEVDIAKELDKKYLIFNVYLVAVLVFIFIFFIVSLAFFFDKRTKYLKYITSSLAGMSKGDFYIKLKVDGNDEISFLANRINMMAEKIQEKFEEERLLEKSKNTLIANLSHDLKSPLTSIIGYLTLVKGSANLTATEKSYIETIFKNSQRLKNRLDELFEFTKLNNTNLKLNCERVNISKLTKQYHQEQNSILETLEFKTAYDIEENIYLNIDVERFIRIFDNVYTNVKKYGTKPGEFFVKLYKKENKVYLSFKNYFVNYTEIDLVRIFDEFYRADEARSDKDSAGLGLFIVKRIVELHNGRVWADIEDKYFIVNIEFTVPDEIEKKKDEV